MQAELTSFLRKANRLLRQAALQALDALVAKYGSSLDPASTSGTVAEASSLINDSDLSIAALSLKLAVTLLERQPGAAQEVVDKVLPAALQLVRSPLLQVSWLRCVWNCGLVDYEGGWLHVDTLYWPMTHSGQCASRLSL